MVVMNKTKNSLVVKLVETIHWDGIQMIQFDQVSDNMRSLIIQVSDNMRSLITQMAYYM